MDKMITLEVRCLDDESEFYGCTTDITLPVDTSDEEELNVANQILASIDVSLDSFVEVVAIKKNDFDVERLPHIKFDSCLTNLHLNILNKNFLVLEDTSYLNTEGITNLDLDIEMLDVIIGEACLDLTDSFLDDELYSGVRIYRDLITLKQGELREYLWRYSDYSVMQLYDENPDIFDEQYFYENEYKLDNCDYQLSTGWVLSIGE